MEPQMHTDAHGWGRTNATALLTRHCRLGLAPNEHAGLRPIRVHRCASVVPLSCLPCLPLLRCPACRSDASGELLCCPPRRPVLVHGLFAVMRQADRRWTNRRRAPVPCAAAASRHRRAVPNWCMGFWPHSAWRSPAALRHRRDRTAGHGVSPPKNAGAGRTRRLDLRRTVQLAPAVGVATGQPCRPVRRATAQARKSLTQMQADGRRCTRIGHGPTRQYCSSGSAGFSRAAPRRTQAHPRVLRASAVHLRKNSCLLGCPPHGPATEIQAAALVRGVPSPGPGGRCRLSGTWCAVPAASRKNPYRHPTAT